MKYLKRFFSKPEISLTYNDYMLIGNKITSMLEIELEEFDTQVKFNSIESVLKDPVSKEFKFHYALLYGRKMSITNSYDDFEIPERLKKMITRFKSKYGFSKVYFTKDSNDDEVDAVYFILSHLDPKTIL